MDCQAERSRSLIRGLNTLTIQLNYYISTLLNVTPVEKIRAIVAGVFQA